MKYRIFFSFILLVFFLQPAYPDSVRISQIDASRLLLNQSIKLYISVTDNQGEPIKGLAPEAFTIYESAGRKDYQRIPRINSFETMANYTSGINFLLLIDNSGSMYRTMQGKRTRSESRRRIYHAKRAVVSFLRSITNPKDRIGLVSYNSFYNSHSGLTDDRVSIETALEKIERPKKEEAYTEIYGSLYLAVDEFRTTRGRKAVIILSDGVNQPYYKYTKKEHPVFGEKIYKSGEPAEYCQEEGISVFAIYFGRKGERKDKGLYRIALETGGAVFDAHSEEQLSDIYGLIVNQILNEYLITYNATMEPADRKYVRVECETAAGKNSATRFYFSSTVFGIPLQGFSPLLILPLVIACALLWFVSRIDFEKKKGEPSIEILNPGAAKASTQLFTLGSGRTVIGGDAGADMTLTGGTTRIREKHATILFDEKSKKFTIAGDGDFSVNNKPVEKKRELEAGDVINIGGTTIVFDDGNVE